MTNPKTELVTGGGCENVYEPGDALAQFKIEVTCFTKKNNNMHNMVEAVVICWEELLGEAYLKQTLISKESDRKRRLSSFYTLIQPQLETGFVSSREYSSLSHRTTITNRMQDRFNTLNEFLIDITISRLQSDFIANRIPKINYMINLGVANGLGSGSRVAGQNIAIQPNPYIYTGSRVSGSRVGGLKTSTQTQPTNPFNYIGLRVDGSISGSRVDFGFMGQFQIRGIFNLELGLTIGIRAQKFGSIIKNNLNFEGVLQEDHQKHQIFGQLLFIPWIFGRESLAA
ncbi:hypothetical protein LXL04_039350 [Taraxacum kok-saghyz]